MFRKCDVLYVHSTKNPISGDNKRFGIMPMGDYRYFKCAQS